MSRPLFTALATFALIGVSNTLLTIGVFNALLYFTHTTSGIGVGIITFIAYAAGIINSYVWNKRWTFKQAAGGSGKNQFLRFCLITCVVAVVCSALVAVITSLYTPPGLTSALWANVVVVLTFPLSMLGNFFGYKLFVFSDTLRKDA